MPDNENNNMNFGVDLLPVTNDYYYLGKTNYKWKIFASEINGINVSSDQIATTSTVNNSRVQILRLNSNS